MINHKLLFEDAKKWWEKVGRDKMRFRSFSNDTDLQQECLNAVNPVHPNYIGGKSGILLGNPWDMLYHDEQQRIAKAYLETTIELSND
jgi:hypothetical protein